MPEIQPINQVTTINAQTQSGRALVEQAAQKQQAPQQSAPPQESQPVESAPPADTTPQPPKTEQQDPRFASLSRKEKALFRREQELKQREKMLQEQAKPWQEAAEVAKVSKVEAMKKLGFTYDQITQEMLGQNAPTPEQLVELKANDVVNARLQEFEKKQQQSQAELTQRQYETALKNIQLEVKETALASDSFPIVKSAEMYDTVTKHIEEQFHKTGRVLSAQEATKQVEQETFDGLLEMAKIPAIRSKLLELLGVDNQQPVATQQRATYQQPTTITNKATQGVAAKDLSSAERRQRAIDVFYGRSK